MVLSTVRQPCDSWTRRSRRGASAVEFAFIGPILFGIILGIIELGRAIMVIHLLNNAAQVGCRTGIIEGKTNAQITSAVVNALSPSGISAESTTVQVNDVVVDANTASAGNEITVIVKVPVTSVTWIPVPRFISGNLQGQFTMRRE